MFIAVELNLCCTRFCLTLIRDIFFEPSLWFKNWFCVTLIHDVPYLACSSFENRSSVIMYFQHWFPAQSRTCVGRNMMTVMLSLAMTPLLLLNFSSWFIACYFILLNCVSVHILQRLTSPPPLLHRLLRQHREDMGRRLPSTARRAERPHGQRVFSCVRREREVLGVRWCGRGLKRVGTCFPAISRMLCRCCDAFKAQCCDWWWRWCYGDNDAICVYECNTIWCCMM